MHLWRKRSPVEEKKKINNPASSGDLQDGSTTGK
jgi:hypothetical protein